MKVGERYQEEGREVIYKIIDHNDVAQVWHEGVGVWGTLKRFKKVIRERNVKLIKL